MQQGDLGDSDGVVMVMALPITVALNYGDEMMFHILSKKNVFSSR